MIYDEVTEDTVCRLGFFKNDLHHSHSLTSFIIPNDRMWRATRCVVHHETVIHSHGDYKSWSGRQYWCNFLSGLIMLAVSWVSINTFIISNDEWSGGVIKTCFTMAWCFLYELHFVDLINFLDSAMVCVALMYTFLKPLCVCVCLCSSHGKKPSHQWHQMHPMVNCSVERSGTSWQIKRSESSRFPLSEQTF